MCDLRTDGYLTNQEGAISPQVILRSFQGEGDYAHIAAIIAGCKDVDQIERVDSEEDIRRYYSHLVNSDPYKDMCFVDGGGQTIGYSRVMWWEETNEAQIYRSLAFLLPAWRRRGIGSRLLEWGENRLREIATDNPPGEERFFESAAADTEVGTQALLESHGYQPVRHFFTMLRPNLENIPEAPLPAGLEVRPVRMEDLPTIRSASVEAFRDHWGFNEENEPTVEQWVENPNFDPSLWRVAWEGDHVAGMVLSFIDERENQAYHRQQRLDGRHLRAAPLAAARAGARLACAVTAHGARARHAGSCAGCGYRKPFGCSTPVRERRLPGGKTPDGIPETYAMIMAQFQTRRRS